MIYVWILLAAVAAIAIALRVVHRARPPERDYDLAGRTVLVTGANSGIGFETAVALAQAGASVMITARNQERGDAAIAAIRERSGSSDVSLWALDLARLDDVVRFATGFIEQVPRLDVLVNNAGLIQGDRSTTPDGFETTFGVNHLGTFVLTLHLLPLLQASAPARIVNLSSVSHKQASAADLIADPMSEQGPYVGLRVYAKSKLANLLFTRELARQLTGTGVTVNAVHPGTVRTGFAQDGDVGFLFTTLIRLARPFFLSPAQGARTSVHVAADPALATTTGAYFDAGREVATSPDGADETAATQLWSISEELARPWLPVAG